MIVEKLLIKNIESWVLKISNLGHSSHHIHYDVNRSWYSSILKQNSQKKKVLIDVDKHSKKKECFVKNIFTACIDEMTKYPTQLNNSLINGVGIKFGESFIIIINKHVKENNIEDVHETIIKSTGTNSI